MIISNKIKEFAEIARAAAAKRNELEALIEKEYIKLNNYTAYRTIIVSLEDEVYSICDTTGDLENRLKELLGLGTALDADFMNGDMPTPFDQHTAEQIVVLAEAESGKMCSMKPIRDLDPKKYTAEEMRNISRARGEDAKKIVEEGGEYTNPTESTIKQ